MVNDPTDMERALAKFQPNRYRQGIMQGAQLPKGIIGRKGASINGVTYAVDVCKPNAAKASRGRGNGSRIITRMSTPDSRVKQDNTGQWVGGTVLAVRRGNDPELPGDDYAESPYKISRRDAAHLAALAADRVVGQFDLRSNVCEPAAVARYAEKRLTPRVVPTVAVTFTDGTTRRMTVAEIQKGRGK